MTSTTIPGYDPPLLGVRVIDLVSGPMQAVSRYLLDFGAQVTRAQLPGVTGGTDFGPVVDGIALGSAIAARGAHQVTVDRSTGTGRQAWDDLLAASDILIENTALGSAAEAALGVEAIREAHPAIGILVLSQHVHARYAIELLSIGTDGIGYLLKERVADLDELSQVHDRHAVADAFHNGHVVRNEKIRERELRLQIEHEIDDLRADRYVERRDGFVRDDDLGLQCKRAGDGDTLALPA